MALSIVRLHVTPDAECLLTDAIRLSLEFELTQEVENASWNLQYLVDCTNNPVQLDLFSSPPTTIHKGPNIVSFSTTELDFSGISNHKLNNASLLRIQLRQDAEVVFQLQLVVQVRRHNGALKRVIFNPID